MPEYSERFFRSGTLRIHFRDWGNPNAPPLIIVHGLRDHSHSFDDLARGLLDRHHVIALDLRGTATARPRPITPSDISSSICTIWCAPCACRSRC